MEQRAKDEIIGNQNEGIILDPGKIYTEYQEKYEQIKELSALRNERNRVMEILHEKIAENYYNDAIRGTKLFAFSQNILKSFL